MSLSSSDDFYGALQMNIYYYIIIIIIINYYYETHQHYNHFIWFDLNLKAPYISWDFEFKQAITMLLRVTFSNKCYVHKYSMHREWKDEQMNEINELGTI